MTSGTRRSAQGFPTPFDQPFQFLPEAVDGDLCCALPYGTINDCLHDFQHRKGAAIESEVRDSTTCWPEVLGGRRQDGPLKLLP